MNDQLIDGITYNFSYKSFNRKLNSVGVYNGEINAIIITGSYSISLDRCFDIKLRAKVN